MPAAVILERHRDWARRGCYGGAPSESDAVHRSRNMMRPRSGAPRVPDPSDGAPHRWTDLPPQPRVLVDFRGGIFDRPPEAFQGGALGPPPQEAHLPFCRPLQIPRVSLLLRQHLEALRADDFLTAKTCFCAGKIICSKR